LRGSRLKPEQAFYGLSPPKFAPEVIEPETFGGTNFKILSQPLGQPQIGYDISLYIYLMTTLVTTLFFSFLIGQK